MNELTVPLIVIWVELGYRISRLCVFVHIGHDIIYVVPHVCGEKESKNSIHSGCF